MTEALEEAREKYRMELLQRKLLFNQVRKDRMKGKGNIQKERKKERNETERQRERKKEIVDGFNIFCVFFTHRFKNSEETFECSAVCARCAGIMTKERKQRFFFFF